MAISMKDIQLTSVDDLLGLNKAGASSEIPLDLIDPFPNHPFHVVQDEALEQLAQSIAQNGVFHKVILRPMGGRYQLIAGHRRVAASKLIGKETIPAVVEEMDDVRATLLMVDSNLRQRQQLLPSEKAFAYKMKLDAIRKKSGERTDLTCGQVDPMFKNKRSRDIVAEETGESAKQISRYIRLTELIPKLLSLVDAGRLPFNPAVELSYLTQREQELVEDIMQRDQSVPTLEQAKRLHAESEAGELSITVMDMILSNNRWQSSINLKTSTLRKYYPSSTPKQIEESLIGILDTYARLKEYFPSNVTHEEISRTILRKMHDQQGVRRY